MKNMFKIVSEGSPTQLEMSSDVLDMAAKISSYINDNFEASDFFTVGNTSHEALAEFLDLLKNAKSELQSDDDVLSLSLDVEQHRIFEKVFMFGRSHGDDIEELEPMHDEIWNVAEVMSPTA